MKRVVVFLAVLFTSVLMFSSVGAEAAVYNVYFDGNGGTSPSKKMVGSGGTVGSLPTSTRTGYTFDGWYTAKSGGTKLTTSTKITSNRTYYAHWTAKSYTVYFHANGGSCSTSYRKVSYGSTIGGLPSASKTGHNFLGWYTAESGGTKASSDNKVYKIVDLYAHWEPIAYTQNFNANGGTVSETSRKVKYNSTIGSLPTPSRTGYTFQGWYTAASGGTKISASTVVKGSATYYAHWTVNSYMVTFNGNGGSSATFKLNYGSTIGTFPNTSRTGYTFQGWYTAASGGTKISTSTVVKGSVTYYAHWTVNPYTVTFNGNGGTSSTKTVNYNSAIGTPPSPTRTGYTFQGWYTAASGGTKISTSTVITGNVTYYAHWNVNSYTVTFNGNGGSSATFKLNYGSTIGTFPNTSRTGYTFQGWYTAASGGTKISTSTVVKGSVTYYAHWTVNSYTVTLIKNDGSSPSSISATYDGTYNALYTPTRTGYTFKGWYTASTGGTLVTTSTKMTTASNHTLYARWEANVYAVNFKGNGGTDAVMKVEYGKTIGSLPGSSRTGYSFDGWYTAADGGKKVASNDIIYASVTYYAHWTANPYTVTLIRNDGSAPSTINATYDKTYSELYTPTKTGYTFKGWYTSPTDGTLVTTSTKVTATANHTLYARWTPIEYTQTFNANGGTISDKDKTRTVAYDSAIGSLYAPSRTGYNFDGWYTAAEGGTKISASTIVKGEATYYAQWSVQKFIVSFNGNGGSSSSMIVDYGTAIGSLPTSSREGYIFDGWYTDAIGNEKITENTKVTGKITYYAHWKVKVTFDTNGGSMSEASSTTLDYGKTLEKLPMPTRDGYTFKGWYTSPTGGTELTKDTVITKSDTYYANWTKKECTVIFDDGTQYPFTINLPWGSQFGTYINRTATPPEYNEFAGWVDTTGTQYTENSIVPATELLRLYPRWQVKTCTVKFIVNGGYDRQNMTDKVSQCGTKFDINLYSGPIPQTGKKFLGWFDIDGKQYQETDLVPEQDVLILYAQYGPYTYNVFFDSAGGSIVNKLRVTHGDTYGTLNAPFKSGYTFMGWYTEPDGKGNRIESISVITRGNDHTLYAYWVPDDEFTFDNFSFGDLVDYDNSSDNTKYKTQTSSDYQEPEFSPEKTHAHNIYCYPELNNGTDGYTEFIIDFYTDRESIGTYWALCNWKMDTSCITDKGATITNYGSCYAGLQFTKNGPKSDIAMWKIEYKDAAGENKFIIAKEDTIYPGIKMEAFDNEGSGSKYLTSYNWEAKKWYRMYLKCYDGYNGNTFVEQWIQDIESGQWEHIVTIDTGLQNSYFKGGMSQFMENFDENESSLERTFAYKNIWLKDTNGTWTSPSSVLIKSCNFTNKKGVVAFGRNNTTLYGISCGRGAGSYQSGSNIELMCSGLVTSSGPVTPSTDDK